MSFFAGNLAKRAADDSRDRLPHRSGNGHPLGIMEGGYRHRLANRARSQARHTDLMARPDSKTLVVIGAGVQGVTQAAAVCAVRPIETIIAVDVSEEQLERFRRRIAEDWPEIHGRDRNDDGAASRCRNAADIICTATTAKICGLRRRRSETGNPHQCSRRLYARNAGGPDCDMRPGAHRRRQSRRGDGGSRRSAQGDRCRGDQRRRSDASSSATSSPSPARAENDEEITFFKSVGNAVQDVVVARFAVDQAGDAGDWSAVGALHLTVRCDGPWSRKQTDRPLPDIFFRHACQLLSVSRRAARRDPSLAPIGQTPAGQT